MNACTCPCPTHDPEAFMDAEEIAFSRHWDEKLARRAERHAIREVTPHFVYRVFDAADRLLYIGCAVDVDRRIATHKRYPGGYGNCPAISSHGVRVESVEYSTFTAAREAEREAIRSEAPWFNRQNNVQRYRQGHFGQFEPLGPEYVPCDQLEAVAS